ncbi:hypothetical protein [Mastigocoleus testarum]|uniref:Uncharacterized protein n=1 Tax=Mastigocoleus testarum BC008 TaxID=371196 RepID=A0A0V7ZDX2_9CYAN|nr:hypothetical protein [Mastigocoleus testarum]KST62454.1 hypothetical protein BC008_09815 [Mastigocoleus testarum BC008]
MSADEYDTPWKEAIESYFQECIEFFFPIAAAGINWKQGYTLVTASSSRCKIWTKVCRQTSSLFH